MLRLCAYRKYSWRIQSHASSAVSVSFPCRNCLRANPATAASGSGSPERPAPGGCPCRARREYTAETRPTPEPPKVNPDDAVLTIKGLCADTTQKGDACKTLITKAQFEKIVENIQPGMAPAMRRQFATRYSQVLTMSTEAEKRGLEKDSAF